MYKRSSNIKVFKLMNIYLVLKMINFIYLLYNLIIFMGMDAMRFYFWIINKNLLCVGLKNQFEESTNSTLYYPLLS